MGKLVVTGVSGNLGGLVLRHLLDGLKVAPDRIIAVTRSPEKLAEFKERGVDVRHGDFGDAESLKKAFAGAERCYLNPTNTQGPARITEYQTAVREAAAAGVTHIVTTSGVTPPAGLSTTFPDEIPREDVVRNFPGITYTIVAYNIWTESLLQGYTPAMLSGSLYTVSAAGKAAHISREDFAKACAAALASNDKPNKKFEVTGLEVLDRQQVADAINKAYGFNIKVVELPESEIVAKLTEVYKNEMWAKFSAMFDSKYKEGQYSLIGHGYEELTGEKPEKFYDFLVRNEAKFNPKKNPPRWS